MKSRRKLEAEVVVQCVSGLRSGTRGGKVRRNKPDVAQVGKLSTLTVGGSYGGGSVGISGELLCLDAGRGLENGLQVRHVMGSVGHNPGQEPRGKRMKQVAERFGMVGGSWELEGELG